MLESPEVQKGSKLAIAKRKLSEFTPRFQPKKILRDSSREELRIMAKGDEITTEFGSACYLTKLKSRSAAFTRTTVDGQVTAEDRKVIREVQEYLKNKTVIEVDRQMCQGTDPEDVFFCRLWVTKPYARLAHMFHASLGPIQAKKNSPDLHVIDVPEFSKERRILVDPDVGVTYVLGSDYYGEIKKGFLRMVMYRGKQNGGLGLHAGSKEVWTRNKKTNQIERSGILFFGLSGTGKTSLTCHDFNLNEADGEKCRVRQDDVVIFKKDGSAKGSEMEGFYIKTEDLNPKDQKALYQAATSPETVFENVYVNPEGKLNFYNTSISKNGRAVAPVSKILNTDGDIDMPLANKIFFITRNPLVPPIARLNPKQAAVAFMLGESIKTSAADPSAKGEPVREVGTNPFIVGSKDDEGNRFYKILKSNPKIECFLLNTGKVGEGNRSREIGILETVAILRAAARDAIEWKTNDLLKLEVPHFVDGIQAQDFDFSRFWSQEDLLKRLTSLRAERMAWLDQFPKLDKSLKAAVY